MEIIELIIAPVITGALTLLGVIVTNKRQQAVRDAVEDEWRKQVSAKLDEHNEYGKKFGNVSEQFTELAITIARIDERLKNLEERK